MPSAKRAETVIIPPPDLIRFAESYLRTRDLLWEEIVGEGSGRRFYRVKRMDASWVVMVNSRPPADQRGVTENDSFLYIAHHLKGKGIPVPEIYAQDRDKGLFLVEDLGDHHLQAEIFDLKDDERRLRETYCRVIDVLVSIQVEGSKGFDPAQTHNAKYDQGFMLAWESGYFHFVFLNDYLGLDIPEEELRDEFENLARLASQTPSGYFLYRDFQSRNIMVRNSGLGLLDFQGARLGPLQYDLASLLLDPYVDLAERLQGELMAYYLLKIDKLIPLDPKTFERYYPFIALHRAMQILGAFAFLTKAKGLGFFQPYIPAAVRNLRTLLGAKQFDPYKRLKRVVFEEIKGL
jgi:aminoglycoside/choline kinase family phosphotransferase